VHEVWVSIVFIFMRCACMLEHWYDAARAWCDCHGQNRKPHSEIGEMRLKGQAVISGGYMHSFRTTWFSCCDRTSKLHDTPAHHVVELAQSIHRRSTVDSERNKKVASREAKVRLAREKCAVGDCATPWQNRSSFQQIQRSWTWFAPDVSSVLFRARAIAQFA
jgi:hypothetical protein